MTIENSIQKQEKKSKVKTEDKLMSLLDEQFARIEQMIDQKLDHYNYRMYNSVKAELRRWFNAYYGDGYQPEQYDTK